MKKIVFMDDVLDALIKAWKLKACALMTMKEIRDALDTVPEIDLKIAKVAPVQPSGNPEQLDALANLFKDFVKLLDMLPETAKKTEAMQEFSGAMGTYLEIMMTGQEGEP